jgi:CubicO group peptidase (beta-lactamase class C family)
VGDRLWEAHTGSVASDAMRLPEPLATAMTADVADAQRRWRTPGLFVGVSRDSELLWSSQVGVARLEPATSAHDDTQVMIGSITKTFTALLVMQLRDEGRLTLEDPLGTWLPESRHASLTVRRLLSHTSGLQREPVGRLWESLDAPDAERLLRELEDAEQVLPPHLAFHYSNLAFALLGQVVERLDGRAWEEALRDRILDPLGMSRTTCAPADDHAHGFQVDPFAGTVTREPELQLRATAPLGGLWSTVADMARYAAFLAEPPPSVLAPETLQEMCAPLVMIDQESWTAAYGLGFELVRSGDRVHVGHRGAMPGFLSALRVNREAGVGVFAVATTTAGAAPGPLATRLLDQVLDALPLMQPAWVPERRQPDLDELLGSWWSEGEELVLEVREGALWMRVAGGSPQDETRFSRTDESTFRAVAGRERGELLELVRRADGRLEKLYFATYAVTRSPLAFADLT